MRLLHIIAFFSVILAGLAIMFSCEDYPGTGIFIPTPAPVLTPIPIPTPSPTPDVQFIQDAAFTTSEGLPGNNIYDVFASGANYYVAAYGNGIAVSTDSGTNWTVYASPSLPSDYVYCIYAEGTTIYAGTFAGLGVSTDSGSTWNSYLTSDLVKDIAVSGGKVYACTANGLKTADTSDLSTWTVYTTAEGLVDDYINNIFLSGTAIYLATQGGLSITDTSFGSWINCTTANGIVQDNIEAVVTSGSTIVLGVNAFINHSTDSGTSFSVNYGTGGGVVMSLFLDGSTVFAGKWGGDLFRSLDLGVNWKGFELPGGGAFGLNMNSVFYSGSTLFIAHSAGLLVGHIE
ncbi:MAG: hypothetical protein JW969_03030 [Spirochaetales bacterium]|nr:hypothetical protein [Spirochaetales bacterium]